MRPLEGKTAVVTGASRGIGSAIAIQLAQAGCVVAVNYLHSQDAATAVVQQIVADGGRAMLLEGDVSRPGDVDAMITRVEQELGGVDLLINNAGILRKFPLEQISLERWEETMRVNLTSSFLMSQAVLPGMRLRSWGRLLFISSLAAQTGGFVGPHYAASKAGMLGLMHSYASLLAKSGITSNAVAPALIETEMVRKNTSVRPDLIPVGRFGQVEEVALAVVMLAQSPYITGQTISVNGGAYMT